MAALMKYIKCGKLRGPQEFPKVSPDERNGGKFDFIPRKAWAGGNAGNATQQNSAHGKIQSYRRPERPVSGKLLAGGRPFPVLPVKVLEQCGKYGECDRLFLRKQRDGKTPAHRRANPDPAGRVLQPQVEQECQQIEQSEFEIGDAGDPCNG